MERRKISYKLYPTAKQSAQLAVLLNLHKNLWNAALEERIDAWRKVGKSVSYEDQCASLTQVRGELPEDWAIANCSSQQITLRRLDKAFKSFFRRVRAGQSPGFPRFKSLRRMPGFGYKGHGDGWRFTPALGERKGAPCWRHGTLRLQGVGHVRARGMARTAGGTIKSCELLHRDGVWHLSLTVECAPARAGGALALAGDWGTEKLLSLVGSDGSRERIENPRWYQHHKVRQLELDQAASRKRRGSRGWHRARRASARLKAKTARQRLDHHHKLSAAIAAKAAIFAAEKLSVKNMTASAAGTIEAPGLNREILDTAPALLMQLIVYKVNETGGQYLEAPTRTLKPSQRCPACWCVKKKMLAERMHRCRCGCEMDRDLAAALVVLRWASEEVPGQELPRAA